MGGRMAAKEQLNRWLADTERAMEAQPETTWTVAKFRIAYPSLNVNQTAITVDNVTAAGNCNARAVTASVNEDVGRVEIETTFAEFDMRGTSNLIGKFQVVLQEGKAAAGHFSQRYADSLYPLHGAWEVPFMFKADFGSLIPRPSDSPVVLRSAEPGEYAIPPIGSWFEKWDPIALVRVEEPDGPTVAVIEHAMHVMLNAGPEALAPAFYWE
jgi:hypothetical protein